MAVTNWKVTFVFGMDEYGWTESYIINTAAGQYTFDGLYNFVISPIVSARLSLLAPTASMTYVRISVVGTPFAVRLFAVNSQGLYGSYTNQPNPPGLDPSLQPNDALLVRLTPASPGPAKSIYLRGLPKEIEDDNGNYNNDPGFTILLRSYFTSFTKISGNSFGWWGVQSKTFAPVSNYAQNADGTVTITTTTNLFTVTTPPTPTIIRISGVNGKSILNGSRVYYPLTTTTAKSKDQIAVSPYIFGGRVEVPVYGYTQAGSFVAERLMTRKCGRALFLERGRQSRRILH